MEMPKPVEEIFPQDIQVKQLHRLSKPIKPKVDEPIECQAREDKEENCPDGKCPFRRMMSLVHGE